MSHHDPAFPVRSSDAKTAPTITSAESAVTTRPIAILVGVDGSLPRLRNNPQIPTMIGVSTTTQNGLMDWYSSVEYNFRSVPCAGILSAARVSKYFRDFSSWPALADNAA